MDKLQDHSTRKTVLTVKYSRGAFTVRILAGMIEKVGLLSVGSTHMALTAWSIYRNWETCGQPKAPKDLANSLAVEFKRTFSRNTVNIEFMGLWDSVNSVGVIRDRMFPFSSKADHIKHIRHAISIDERRTKFKQNLFCPIPSDFAFTETADELPDSPQIDLQEIWFPGSHSDVGGGWLSDDQGHCLSNIPLRWMIAQALKYGVLFSSGSVSEFDLTYPTMDSLFSYHHDPLQLIPKRYSHNLPSPHHSSSTATSLLYDILEKDFAAMASSLTRFQFQRKLRQIFPNTLLLDEVPPPPVYRFDNRGEDSIIRCLKWWLLELLPIGVYQNDPETNRWVRSYRPNLGKRRVLPRYARFHWSLFWRLYHIEDYNPSNLTDMASTLFEILKQNSTNETGTHVNQINEFGELVPNTQINWKQFPNDLQLQLSATSIVI